MGRERRGAPIFPQPIKENRGQTVRQPGWISHLWISVCTSVAVGLFAALLEGLHFLGSPYAEVAGDHYRSLLILGLLVGVLAFIGVLSGLIARLLTRRLKTSPEGPSSRGRSLHEGGLVLCLSLLFLVAATLFSSLLGVESIARLLLHPVLRGFALLGIWLALGGALSLFLYGFDRRGFVTGQMFSGLDRGLPLGMTLTAAGLIVMAYYRWLSLWHGPSKLMAGFLFAVGVSLFLGVRRKRREARRGESLSPRGGRVSALAGLALLVPLTLHHLPSLSALVAQTGRPIQGANPAERRPRLILFVTFDSLSPAYMGAYGYPRPTTPFFDRLAQKGVLFERAYASAYFTTESFDSLFTSRHGLSLRPVLPEGPRQHPLSGDVALLNPAFPTLQGLLKGAGFLTVQVSPEGHEYLFEEFTDPSFGVYLPPHVDQPPQHIDIRARALFFAAYNTLSQVLLRYSTAWQWALFMDHVREKNSGVIEVIRSHRGRPLFVHGHLYDTREDFFPILTLGPSGKIVPGEGGPYYDDAVLAADVRLQNLLGSLEGEGLLEDALIIVSADHGDRNLPRPTWVPLLMLYPRVLPEGRRIPRPVSLIDVAPTILELAGVPVEGLGFDGRSLLGLIQGRDEAGWSSRKVFIRQTSYAALLDERWRYEVRLLRGKEGGPVLALPQGLYRMDVPAELEKNEMDSHPEVAREYHLLMERHIEEGTRAYLPPVKPTKPRDLEELKRIRKRLGYE